MEKFRQFLENSPILMEFKDFLSGKHSCFLVGGAVRDAWLGRPVKDFDFATPEDPTPLARAWARHCGGHWFWLDEARRQSRVVLGRGTQEPTFDFAPFRAPSLEGDLRGRDFTLNALALPCGGEDSPELIDPLGGAADLAAHRLRACAPTAFEDDPLRVLRAARFAAVLGARPDEDTLRLARTAAPRLAEVAGERVKAELHALLAAEEIARGLEVLAASGALAALSLGGGPESVQVASREIESFSRRIASLSQSHPEIRALLEASLEAGLTGATLLRMAVFLRACPPRIPLGNFTRRLALSRATTQRLGALMRMEPAILAPPPTGSASLRQLAQWAARFGRYPGDALLLHAGLCAPDASTAQRLTRALSAWLSLNVDGRIPPLVEGTWLTRELGISEGKQVGLLLGRLADAEARGLVDTPETARNFLKSLNKKED